MKAKTKQKSKSVSTKAKNYPAYILGIVLVVAITGEAALFTAATPADWQAGISVLDASRTISETVSSVKTAFAPAMFVADSINEFYHQASIAMVQILTPAPNVDPLLAVKAVDEFYAMATRQMMSLLDVTNYISNFGPQPAYAMGLR
jgi:hypothetical protein